MKTGLLHLLFLLVPWLAFSQKLVINEIGFDLAEAERNAVGLMADYEAMLYNGLFDTRRNDSLLITINIYKKFSDYKKVCLETAGGVVSKTGFYSPAMRQVFVYKHPEFMRTVVHEMSHCFMHHNMKDPPRWLNEGIAVFFESLAVENGKVSVTTQPDRIAAVKRELREGNIDLASFLRLTGNDWQGKSKLDYMYNVSYSIVFLITKISPDATKRVILALKKGHDSIQAIESAFGSFESFEVRYRLFYR